MALSSPGVGSGLDVNNIVGQLMSIERRPLDQLDRREVAYQAQLSAYGNLRSALSSFQSAVWDLDRPDKFTTPSATSADATILSASAESANAKSAIEAFVNAYNELNGTLRDLSKFDPQTQQTGPLIGDTTLRTIQNQLRSTFSAALGGLGGSSLQTLSQAGIAFQLDGMLAIENGKLAAALAGNAEELGALFTTVGRTRDSLVGYAGATSATRPGSYAVDVSALATRGALVGSADAGLSITTGVNDQFEIAIDGIAASVTLAPGRYTAASLAAQVQAAVNGAAVLSAAGAAVVVSESGGALTITSKRYGSASTLSAGGNAAAGLLGAAPVATIGTDVAGTLNGAPALGKGQTLTGADATAPAGLALQVSGGSLGNRGRVEFARGYANKLASLLGELLASGGPISGRTDGINRSIEDLDDRRTTLESRLQVVEQRYRAQFAALGALVSNLQSTSNFLTQQLARLPVPGSDQS